MSPPLNCILLQPITEFVVACIRVPSYDVQEIAVWWNERLVLEFIIFMIIIACYVALSLLLAQSALHSITPARIASLGNLTYCCYARHRSQYPLQLGSHISPEWRETQSRLTSCPRMLSHMKQLASVGIEPQSLYYESDTLTTEPYYHYSYWPTDNTV